MLKGGSVLKSIVKALGLIVCLALSGAVCAMGMGGINVITALGEPLKAEIELVAVGKAEKSSLSAHLASPDAFKGAGMDYPSNLPSLKFQIETRASGEPYLKVTSIQPVNEPFVSLLVELSWSSGKLLREYTFLLDPPGYKAEQPKTEEVKPVAPSAAAAPSAPIAPKIIAQPIRATVPVDKKVFAEAATPARDKKSAVSGNVATGTIKVKHGDTLSEIALHSKPSGVSLERMLVALYRANADEFDGKNMNRLKTGKILQMPKSQDLDKLAQIDAVKEIRVQVADWHAYRQKLASASGAVAEHAPKQETSGKISTTVADKAPAAKEPAKEVVRLSKGEAPGSKAVTAGNTKSSQDRVHALEEEAIAKSKALNESSERVAMLEKNIKEMQHLMELKGQPVAPVKPSPGKVEAPAETKPAPKLEPAKAETKPSIPASAVVPVVASQPHAASAIAAVSAVTPASTVKPAVKPIAPKVVPPPPSMLDDPLYQAGGAAVLLALGGLGFMLARRGKGDKVKKKVLSSNKEEEKDIGVTSGRISAPTAPSPETGDFTQAAVAVPISQAQPEDVDPINEADLFLSFGRDAQAEEILKDALEKNPASNPIRLKLLSIYASRKDTKLFSSIARQVQDSGDTAAWAQAAEMGRNLEPNNPMYGGAGGETVIAAQVDQGKSGQQQAAGLDFDLGSSESSATADAESLSAPPVEKAATAPAVDFDLGFDGPTDTATENKNPDASLAAPVDVKTATTPGLDFDLGLGEEPGLPAKNTAEDLASTKVLNVPLGEKAVDMPSTGLHAAETPMDFDITATHQLPAAPELGQDTAITPNLDDLVFDITATHSSTAAAITEERPAVNALESPDEGLAFTLDFPATDKTEPAPAQAATKGTVDVDLSGLSLDMDEPTASASAPVAEVKDAHWHDVATKLDLAKAYQEMGDNAGAREILEEVLAEGDDKQCAAAEEILQQLLD